MSGKRITKAQRWLDLIACLLGRHTPMTVDEIFRAVPAYRIDAGPDGDPAPSSVRRKFERDKDELRELGIPIDTVSFRVNYGSEVAEGYRLRPGALYLPYVRIIEDAEEEAADPAGGDGDPTFAREELEIALEALREAAEIPGWPFVAETRSAFQKLAYDLGSVPEGPSLKRTAPPGGQELGGVLQVINDALLRRKRLEFRYHGMARGEVTDRDVAPYGLLMERGTWYLVGHDELREALRMFHVGRMESPRINASSPASPDYDIPDGFSLADYRDREAWEFGDEQEALTVRVRFAHPVSLWAERNGYGELEAVGEDDGVVRCFEVRHARPFLCWILGLRGDARIVDPPELADELRDLAGMIGAAHD